MDLLKIFSILLNNYSVCILGKLFFYLDKEQLS